MRLLDLSGEGMVMALRAVDVRAIDDWRNGLGDELMLIAALVEKPRCSLALGFLRAGDQKIAHCLIPWAIGAKGVFEKSPPAVLGATVFLGSALGASH